MRERVNEGLCIHFDLNVPKALVNFKHPWLNILIATFRSITGGYVLQSEPTSPRFTRGVYICGDHDTGKLWSLRVDGTKAIENRQLSDTDIRTVEFAQDSVGEVYLPSILQGGGLHRIVNAPPQVATKPFPRKLSETGLFA